MSDTERLRNRIASELNRQRSDVLFTDGSGTSLTVSLGLAINREINSAIRHHESTRFRFNEIRESEFTTTSDGTRTYSMPVNIVRMDTLKLVYNSDSYVPLKFRTWAEIEGKDRDVTGSTGLPAEYAIYGNVLRLFPVPNGTYTLVGSYIRRFNTTSLTGSYTSGIPIGGASLTVTSTASHNNRTDGWTTDGEDLIRARAIAGVRINYFNDEKALLEMAGLANKGEPFLSVREKQAFERLVDEANDLQSSGIKPYEI